MGSDWVGPGMAGRSSTLLGGADAGSDVEAWLQELRFSWTRLQCSSASSPSSSPSWPSPCSRRLVRGGGGKMSCSSSVWPGNAAPKFFFGEASFADGGCSALGDSMPLAAAAAAARPKAGARSARAATATAVEVAAL
eukprot:CAMPEP_0204196550 /NCGR_PEP_ID=MMETSP0361-20130328/63913_1 /ASSEMBLY_ACC=CAM_ASM_000343 /TAXON_ID=268821 /ORGANISM="Scrippsiella Hangoei, Strain SHTV-5" /LENGTH=136 /DNA_ID=CAMNT_0051158315 /DNA_START=11 /DNA_END=423 /DNA_ORIENTATION=+